MEGQDLITRGREIDRRGTTQWFPSRVLRLSLAAIETAVQGIDNARARQRAEYEAICGARSVYTTHLRSHYRDKLAPLKGQGRLTAKQSSLGDDPLHPLLKDPTGDSLGWGTYAQNIEALAHALEMVAALWKNGSGGQGLLEQRQQVSSGSVQEWSPVL